MIQINLKNWQLIKIITILICAVFVFPHALFAYDAMGQVVGILSGDTIKVSESDGTMHKIRLYGIDAPEKGQDFGRTASDFLSIMIAGKKVEFRVVDKDRYGMSVAYVYLDGICINAAMVKAGYAWVYAKECKDHVCNKWIGYQRLAHVNKKGLWKQHDAVPPWEWSEVNQIVEQRLQALEDANAYNSPVDQTRPNNSGYRVLSESTTVEQMPQEREDSNANNGSANPTSPNNNGAYVIEIRRHVRHYRRRDDAAERAYQRRPHVENHSTRLKGRRKISQPNTFHEKRNERRDF
jgi:endonuclease YncB( thermonuclease family)